ncbi:hypothetical protein WA026_017269 [Henosepilachna vigintioctopunctata]|uniref:Complex I assembly factor TIMMDC1, mitochondrial n=1 Tax=Henosepilachna vigintioctopunctata TaxID=420089 RepID=A0AAW1UML8_9CUCU
MLRYLKLIKHKGIIIGCTIPVVSTNSNETKVATEIQKNETSGGWNRLKKMIEIDEFGDISREMKTISQTAMLSSFIGFLFGSFMSTRTTYSDFMRNHTATSFTSHFEAKKKLQDAMTKSVGRGGWKWCWRLCLFSTTYVGLSTMISVYRGKNGILEFILAGTATGALYKWQMGPKGWIVGAVVGSFLGLTSGAVTYGILELTGQTMDEVRIHQQSFGDYRSDMWRKGIKEYREREDHHLRSHNQKVLNENPVEQ